MLAFSDYVSMCPCHRAHPVQRGGLWLNCRKGDRSWGAMTGLCIFDTVSICAGLLWNSDVIDFLLGYNYITISQTQIVTLAFLYMLVCAPALVRLQCQGRRALSLNQCRGLNLCKSTNSGAFSLRNQGEGSFCIGEEAESCAVKQWKECILMVYGEEAESCER